MEHVQHVSTQLPYAMTVAGVSFVTYIFAGFIQNAVIGPLAKAFVIEFYIVFRDLMEELEPSLKQIGL